VSAASLFRELPDFCQELSQLMLLSAARQKIGAEISAYKKKKKKRGAPGAPRTIFVS